MGLLNFELLCIVLSFNNAAALVVAVNVVVYVCYIEFEILVYNEFAFLLLFYVVDVKILCSWQLGSLFRICIRVQRSHFRKRECLI